MSIETRLYDANGPDSTAALEDMNLESLGPEQLLWVDVGRNGDDLARVAGQLDLGDGLRSFESDQMEPRLVRGDGSVRLRAIGLRPDAEPVERVPVDFIARRGLVISVHEGDVAGLNAPTEETEGETRLGHLDAGTFLAVLLDGLLGAYFHAVEDIEQRIDRLDVVALRADHPDDLLASMVALRSEIALLRRALAPQRTIFASLSRPDAELEEDVLRAAWPGLTDRFQQAVEAVENARELLIGSFDIVMTRTGQRTNDVMRVLTVISAVLLPSVVLAGVMGMNFQVGFFSTAGNFYLVLLLMVVMAAAILGLARWRHWL
jgi:magnesium transporter